MRNLITAQEVIELAFAENSNMREESISATSIHIAEIKYIRPAFGDMYALLSDKYADFTNDYVKPALAYFVKCEIVSSIAIDMSNSGIAVANPQYQSAASDKQRQRLYDSEMSKAKALLDFALEYVATHSSEFPDFRGNAPKKHHRVGGLILGDGPSVKTSSIAGEAYKGEINKLNERIDDLEERIDDIGSGGGNSDNNYTDEDKALVQTIPNKQDKLTLAVKDNGNIVIGTIAGQTKEFMPATPSGDPMHEVYLSYYGVSYNQESNLYSLGYLTDLTADDMRKAFATYGGGIMSVAYNSTISSYALNAIVKNDLPRTTLPQRTTLARIFYDRVRFSFMWVDVEQIFIGITPTTPDMYNSINIWQYNSTELSFYLIGGLQKLKYIVDVLYCNMSHALTMFNTLPALQEVRLLSLKGDVSFSQASNLSKESILFMIVNSNPTTSITITLHATAYAMAMADSDIVAALNSNPLVHLASA